MSLSQVVWCQDGLSCPESSQLKGQKLWIKVSHQVKSDVREWTGFVEGHMFRTFSMMVQKFHVYMDASGTLGYGGWMGSVLFFGGVMTGGVIRTSCC